MGLLERLSHPGQAVAWEGEIPISNRYTAGVAGEQFLRRILEHGQLVGSRCPECELTYVPPRLYCERCFAHLEDWLDVPATGQVHTFTIVHLDLDGQPLAEPVALAFVRLDGADGGLVHFLGDVNLEQVHIGMSVEAVFRDKAERKGSILDIAYFRPI